MRRPAPARLAAVVLAMAGAVAAYWYFSPYLVIRTLQVAAQERDFETLNRHVDYPRLREHLKVQLQEATAQRTRRWGDHPLAGLAGSMASAAVGAMVELFVRPVTLMYVLRTGELAVQPSSAPAPASPASAPAPASAASAPAESATPPPSEGGARWRVDRDGLHRLVVYPRTQSGRDGAGVVLEREGFARWRVTGLLLPDSAAEAARAKR